MPKSKWYETKRSILDLGRPHPIDGKSFDETVSMLQDSVDKAKLGDKEKSSALKRLHSVDVDGEKSGNPIDFLSDLIDAEWVALWKALIERQDTTPSLSRRPPKRWSSEATRGSMCSSVGSFASTGDRSVQQKLVVTCAVSSASVINPSGSQVG